MIFTPHPVLSIGCQMKLMKSILVSFIKREITSSEKRVFLFVGFIRYLTFHSLSRVNMKEREKKEPMLLKDKHTYLLEDNNGGMVI
jgi:hypothetical protein